MNIGFLVAGFIFLSSPNVGIYDFLPDFFGCLLIIHGIGLAKLFSPSLKKSFRSLVILFVVNFGKMLLIPLLFKDIRALPIVLSFTFAIAECILLISVTSNFFEGLFYIGVRYDIPSVFQVKGKNEQGIRIKHFAVVFFIIRSAISIIPDVSDLYIGTDNESVFSYTDLKSLFSFAVIIIGSIFAVVFLAQLIPYLNRIKNDPQKAGFDSLCSALYNDPAFANTLNMRRVIVVTALTVITSLFLSIDGIIIPGAVPAVLTIVLLFVTNKKPKALYWLILPAVSCCALSIFDFIYRRKYYVEMHNEPEASLWSPASAEIYNKVKIFTLAERLLVLIILISSLYWLYNRIKNDCLALSSENNADIYSKNDNNALLKRFRILLIVGLPVYLSTAFEPILVLEIDFISVLISVINLLWIVLLVVLLFDIFKSIYKLSLENIPPNKNITP